jgi:hypothetical protein
MHADLSSAMDKLHARRALAIAAAAAMLAALAACSSSGGYNLKLVFQQTAAACPGS